MQVKSPANESIPLTFSIIAKIFLPKSVSENTSRLLFKWLKEKFSPQIFAQSLVKLIDKYPVVYDSWLVVSERKQMAVVPQFQTIYQTVLFFEQHRVPRQLLFSFISMILNSISTGTTKKCFITQILTLNLPKACGISVQSLMQHAFSVLDIVPKKKLAVITRPTEVLITDEEQEENTPEQPAPPPPLPVGPATRIGVSYIKAVVEPSKSQSALVTNNSSKSLASGSEGQMLEHISESVRFISELQVHMYTIFETLVRADQLFRAFLYAGSMEGILLTNATQALYGSLTKDLLSNPYDAIYPVISKRCKAEMNDIFAMRTQTEEHVDLMTNHMPKFDFSPTLSFSTRKEPFHFVFSANSQLVADLLKRIGNVHSQGLVYFLDTLMPLFVLTKCDEKLCIIGTDTICNALYLFARCAISIEHFFSSSYPPEHSLNDIIRAAECEASLKYSRVTNTHIEEFLEDFLKKFFANDFKFYELVEEAESRFGLASRDLFTLVMYITQLDALCSRFAAQFKLTKFSSLAKFFSRASGKDAQKSLESRFKFYLYKSQVLLISPLVKIEMSYGETDAVITPI